MVAVTGGGLGAGAATGVGVGAGAGAATAAGGGAAGAPAGDAAPEAAAGLAAGDGTALLTFDGAELPVDGLLDAADEYGWLPDEGTEPTGVVFGAPTAALVLVVAVVGTPLIAAI